MSVLQKILQASLLFICFLSLCPQGEALMSKRSRLIPIGLVLDLKSIVGSMAHDCFIMALDDFYKQNPHYETRLSLRIKDSENDVAAAAFAALDLIKNEKVYAIVGPQTTEQTRFVLELGGKHHVPIISFSATSPVLPSPSRFFIRTVHDDRSQVKAIAAIAEAYGWQEINLIYEDTDFGNGLVPYLTDALEESNTRVPYKSAIDPYFDDSEVSVELSNLKRMSTRIFLVHMRADLGSKFFELAKSAGMMCEGYAWIVTQGLSVLLNPLAPKVVDSMQGVLGVRPMVSKTKELDGFKRRWKALPKAKNRPTALGLFGLWAYDTAQALAMAVEKAERQIASNTSQLINAILATGFQGLSGDFNLLEGQLKPSTFEVFNVIGRTEKIIGYWSPERGLFRDLSEPIAKEKLKQPIWPGLTTELAATKFRIGVPVKHGFTEFLKVEISSQDRIAQVSGFAIDVFLEVVKVLPFAFPYKFVPFNKKNASYDELLCQINAKKFDAVIGDITIVANRTEYVDFTLPYLDSSLVMVVSKIPDHDDMWILLKPLSFDVWMGLLFLFLCIGLIILTLEQHANTEFRNISLVRICCFPLFAHEYKLVSPWSRIVLVLWTIVLVIITQIYTATLTSMLSARRVRPSFDLKEIKRNNVFVGYQSESFVKGLLIEHFKLDESKLKAYDTPEEYDKALSLGSKKGGVDAIFDETPYINLFLKKYGSKYMMAGTTFKTHGLGLAFGPKSPLVSYFSRAILNVTQDKDIFEAIKYKYFPNGDLFEDQSVSNCSNSSGLTLKNISGLFFIMAIIFILSLFLFLGKSLYRFFNWEERPSDTIDSRTPNEEGDNVSSNEDSQTLALEGPAITFDAISQHSTSNGERPSDTIDSRTPNEGGDNVPSNEDNQALALEGPAITFDATSQHSASNGEGQDSIGKRLIRRIKDFHSRMHVWEWD